MNEQVLAQLLNGISTRKFEKAAETIPATFGISKSSVSRKFIQASAKKLKELNQRDLQREDIVAIFMDGKSFAENEILIVLGVTLQGEKKILGILETSTENHRVGKDFLHKLKDRGLRDENKILFIMDGAKGLRKGIEKVFGDKAIVQRCQWHKRENVMAYLPKSQQDSFRRKLQTADQQPDYETANKKLNSIRKELLPINQSAVNSLDEGLEETLTLPRLGVFEALGGSLKTTNCIESINSQWEQDTHRVNYWKNSNQRQRWVATALLEIEPSLRKIRGYQSLTQLRRAMTQKNKKQVLADVA